jgi:hypothetical protein
VKVVPEEHLRWIEELPLIHVDRHQVYVHAGVDPDLPLAAQDPDQLSARPRAEQRTELGDEWLLFVASADAPPEHQPFVLVPKNLVTGAVKSRTFEWLRPARAVPLWKVTLQAPAQSGLFFGPPAEDFSRSGP